MTRTLASVCLLVLASGGHAEELWRDGQASLAVSGSVREIVSLGRGTDRSRFGDALTADPTCTITATFPSCDAWKEQGDTTLGTSLTRFRLQVDARATESLSAVVVYDHEVRAGTLDTLEARIGRQLATQQIRDLGSTPVETDAVEWRHALYRAHLNYEGEHLEVVVGRQRIPWGVGRLWNPIDRFNAIGPLAIEPDQSPGVDAAKVRWLFSGFTYVEAIYALGEQSLDRAYALRLSGVLRDVDYSVMGGIFEEAPTLGFDLAMNLGDAAGRIEVVWTNPTRDVRPFGTAKERPLPDYWQAVVSIDHDFEVGKGLYTLVEHLYNGNALGFGRGRAGPALGFFQEADMGPFRVPAAGSPDLLGQSRVASAGKHLTGLQFSYDLLADLRGSFLTLYDWGGQSASFFPSLVYSPYGWLELTLGVQTFAGGDESEFGTAETTGFLIAEAFF